MPNKSVCIAIHTHDETQQLKETLKSVLNGSYKDLHVFVHDSGQTKCWSDPECLTLIQQFTNYAACPGASVKASYQNVLQSVSQADYVLFVKSGIKLAKHAIQQALKTFLPTDASMCFMPDGVVLCRLLDLRVISGFDKHYETLDGMFADIA